MDKDEQIEYLLLLQEKRKREVEESFCEFVKDAFEVIHHDDEMVYNWHIGYLYFVTFYKRLKLFT